MRTKKQGFRQLNSLKAKTIGDDPDDVQKDFKVAVTVVEARKLARSSSTYVVVSLGKVKHRTAVQRKTECPCYGENFEFEVHSSTREMQRSCLVFAVMEARCPPRLMGETCVELAAVWTEPHHTVFHKWAQLCLPKDAAAGTTGYLKVDISILCKGQDSVPIPCDEKIEDNLLLPAGSEQQRACYQVTVYAAYSIPSNTNNHPDRNCKPPSTFVRISFSGLVAKTSVVPRSINPEYSEQVSMVEMFPNICQTMRLEVCSADGPGNRVLAGTNLTLTQISHGVENGFLPTFGPSLLHMWGSWSCCALAAGDDGPYHRGSLLVALKTEVPYNKHCLRSIAVQPVPSVTLECLCAMEEFCVLCSVFEVSMLDNSGSGKLCGVAITMCDVKAEECGDLGIDPKQRTEFNEMADTIKQDKLHYTGSMNIYNSTAELGYLEFSNEFPVLQLATRLPDYRVRMYRNNMVHGIVVDLESRLSTVESRLHSNDFSNPSELVDLLISIRVEVAARIVKYVDITTHAMSEEQQCTTELDRKQTMLQKEEMDKIHQRLTKKAKRGSNIRLLSTGSSTWKPESSTRKLVKVLLAELRMALEDLKSLMFPTPDGWPDIVLWLLSNGSRVAYAKIAPADVVFSVIPEQRGRNYGRVHTVFLKPLKCLKHLGTEALCDCIAGKVELLCWVGPYRQRNHFESSLPADFQLKTNEAYMYIKGTPLVAECHVNIYRAKLNVEEEKKVSPVARVNFVNAVKETQVKPRSVSPLWNEVVRICQSVYSTSQRLSQNPPAVLVEVYDTDDTNRNCFLGRVHMVPVVDEREECPPALKWFDLYKGAEQTGRILMSAQLIQKPEFLMNTTYYYPAHTTTGAGQEHLSTPEPLPDCLIPVPSTYKVDVYWWGLRDVSMAHKPCVALQLEDVCIKSCILNTTSTCCNFPHGKTSQVFEGDIKKSLCSPVTLKLFDSSTFGRSLFVGLKEVHNPLKYVVEWIPKHEREATLCSNSITSPDFFQVNQMMFIKKTNKDSDYDDYMSTSSKELVTTGRLPRWKRLFRREADEERYSLLPVYTKSQVVAKTVEKDWWTRYAESLRDFHEVDKNTDDSLVIYDSELEYQPGFSKFKDWCSTLKIYNGKKTGMPDKDEQIKCGYLKVGLVIYEWPPPETTVAVSSNGVDLERGYFAEHPENEPARLLVRVYLIKAELAAKGFAGKTAPYATLQCGKKVLGGKSLAPWTSNPVFGKMYEFRCCLPEDYQVRVSLMDGDASPPEDLIGSTTIDLEDRVYSKHRACVGLANEYYSSGPARWRDCQRPSAILEELCQKNHLRPPLYPDSSTVTINGVEYRDFEHSGKLRSGDRRERLCLKLLHQWHTLPICGYSLVPEHVETRTLYNAEKPMDAQGKVQLWVDIFPLHCSQFIPPPVDITPRQVEEYELRAVVWAVRGVRLKGACDIYVKAWIGPSDEAQDTDIHYHSLNGEGSFNWRMVFRFQYQPAEGKLVLHEKGPFTEVVEHFPPILVVQVQDSEAVSPEDYLGTVLLDLTSMPRGEREPRLCTPDTLTRRKLNLFTARAVRAWWPLKSLDRNSEQYFAAGMIDLELTLLPTQKAVLMPVGLGRDPPSPLPKPLRDIPRGNWKSMLTWSRPLLISALIVLSALVVWFVLVPLFIGAKRSHKVLDSIYSSGKFLVRVRVDTTTKAYAEAEI